MIDYFYKCLPKRIYQNGDYVLEAVQPEHIEKIREWRNGQMDILRQAKLISKEEQIIYYKNHVWPEMDKNQPDKILLSIFEDQKLIGYGGLTNISWDNLRGEISFLLDTDIANTKKDYGELLPIFLMLMKQIAFNELKLFRIYGELFDLRPKYEKTFENSGFKLEGVLKEHNVIKGKPVNSKIYGILKKVELNHDDLKKINPNILITSISKKVPMIRSVVKGVKKINGAIKIIGGDSNDLCIGKYFVDQFWKMPQLNELSFKNLIDYCKENKIGLIIPTRDGELNYFSSIKDDLLKENIFVMVSDKENILLCLDKLQFSQLKKINAIPSSENVNEISSNRYVVKERFGAGSHNIGINLNKNNAISFAEKLNNPIYQPFIIGYEISVDAYISRKGTVKGLIMRRRDNVINGESIITTSFHDKNMEKEFNRILSYLNLYGHVILQAIISDKGEVFIIECNPRFGGASTLSIYAGLDSFYWAYLESMKAPIENYPYVRCKKEIKQVRYPNDYYP